MKNGFTLIELIVVVGIISILSTLGLSTYNNVQVDARNARRKADLRELKTALETYKFRNNNRYPSTIATTCPGATATNMGWCGACTTWNGGGTYTNNYIPGLAPTYVSNLPHDPREGKVNPPICTTAANNCYLYRSNGTDYKLLAYCTPEGTWTSADPFYDSKRTTHAWQVSSSSVSAGW